MFYLGPQGFTLCPGGVLVRKSQEKIMIRLLWIVVYNNAMDIFTIHAKQSGLINVIY
jgi:hypothetical protein